MRAMWSAASGMRAQQLHIDAIANNLANVNTTGFKRSTVSFQDLFYDELRAAGAPSSSGQTIPSGLRIGHGVKLVGTRRIFSPGKVAVTDRPLDLMIEGDGFFQVELPDGTLAYTRDGSLQLDAEGRVVTADGMPVVGFGAVEPDATAINVGTDGTFSTTVAGGVNEKGQVSVFRFANPAGLRPLGRNLLVETAASGEAESGTPGEDGFGALRQGALEMSNVQVVEEMVNLIAAQRAYEVNSKAIQASDDMLQMANNLRR